jgi:hypothetical protein
VQLVPLAQVFPLAVTAVTRPGLALQLPAVVAAVALEPWVLTAVQAAVVAQAARLSLTRLAPAAAAKGTMAAILSLTHQVTATALLAAAAALPLWAPMQRKEPAATVGRA